MRTNLSQTQTQMYGEILSLEDQYRAEMAQLPRWTENQRRDFVERARKGDMQAREHLVLSCAGYVASLARKYAVICADSSTCIEFLDLVQLGNLTALERMDKALAHPNTIGYLYKSISGAIIEYCQTHSRLIVTPKDRNGRPLCPIEFKRLNKPVPGERKSPLEDVLWMETRFPESASTRGDHMVLHTAVESLPGKQRETLKRHYGLEGAAEPLQAIGEDFRSARGHAPPATRQEWGRCYSLAHNYQQRALQALKRKLEPVESSA